jgi:hypothetical protein
MKLRHVFVVSALCTTLVIGGAAGTAGAAVGGTAAASGAGNTTTYVGTVAGTGAYVAIVVGKKSASGYICDGDQVAHWFKGTAKGGNLALADTATGPAGALLIGAVHGSRLDGLVRFDGAQHRLVAQRATGKAGLYRKERSIGGVDYAAGWVKLPDGSFKGQVTVATRLPTTTSTTSPPTTTPPTTTPTTVPARTVPTTAAAGSGAVTASVGTIAPATITTQFPTAPPPDAKSATVPGDSTLPTGNGTGSTGSGPGTSALDSTCSNIVQMINAANADIDGLRAGHRIGKLKVKDFQQEIFALQTTYGQDGCQPPGGFPPSH